MRLKPGPRLLAAGLAAVTAMGLLGTAGVALAEDSGAPPPDPTGWHQGLHRPAKRGFVALVKASGLSREVIAQGLKDGQSLSEIFEANGVLTDELIQTVLDELEMSLERKVEAGVISQDQADRIYAAAQKGLPRIADAHRPPPHHHPRLGRDALVHELKIAADTIGIPPAELADALRNGATIADVARDHDVEPTAVIDAMYAPVRDRIDEAVANGRIDEERGDRLKEGAFERITKFVNEGLPNAPSP